MGIFGKRDTYDSPFDDYKLRNGIHTKDKPSGIPSFDLSFSGALLMILSVVTLSFELSSTDNILLCSLLYLVVLFFWFFSIRFIMTARFPALNFMVNSICFCGVGFCLKHFLNFNIGMNNAIFLIPLILGLSIAASEERKKDKKTDFCIKNYLIPVAVAAFYVTLDAWLMNLINRREVFIVVLLASAEIMLTSYIASKVSDKLVVFCGGRLADVYDIPQNSKSDSLRFLSARIIDLAYYLLGFTAFLFIYSSFGKVLPFEISEIIVLIFFSVYGILAELIDRKDESPFAFSCSQYMIYILAAIQIFLFRQDYIRQLSVVSAIVYCLMGFLIYVLFLALATTYKRRLLFADINQHARGVPHYLLLIGIILMIINAIVMV